MCNGDDRTEPWPTGKQLAALNLLAACPNGCTEAAMKANGFGIGLATFRRKIDVFGSTVNGFGRAKTAGLPAVIFEGLW